MSHRWPIVALLFVALHAGVADAATRYASPAPTAMTSGTCATEATACTLTYAVNNGPSGSEIVVGGGSYAASQTLLLPAGANIHGKAGVRRPVIGSTAANFALQTQGASASDKARIADLVLLGRASTLVYVNDFGATIERVVLSNKKDGAVTLSDGTHSGTMTLRSSIVRAQGTNAKAGAFQALSPSRARNVTFWATGKGSLGVWSTSNGVTNQNMCYGVGVGNVDLVSSIAHGDGFDLSVQKLGCGTAPSLKATNSSFQTKQQTGGATVTSGGGNIANDPAAIFVKPSDGDFHELAGAPTINAGATADGFTSATDVDGFAWSGLVTDMGATEFFQPAFEKPTVSDVTDTTATLAAPVTTNGLTGTAHFVYTTAGADQVTPDTDVPADGAIHTITASLTGLPPATAYSAKFVVAVGNVNYTRTFVSDAVPFTTTAAPIATTDPAQQPVTSQTPTAVKHCVVPKLGGLTLKRARKALRKAGCRLGKARGRKRHHGTGHVRRQSRKAGKTLKAGTKVSVRLRYPVIK
jgi:hypothetical protein